jgi:aarF domain-containing kinase
VQVGALLGDVLGLCCEHKVLLEARFASVVAAIAVLEGLGRSLDPDLDLLKEATPVVLKAATKRKEIAKALRNGVLQTEPSRRHSEQLAK